MFEIDKDQILYAPAIVPYPQTTEDLKIVFPMIVAAYNENVNAAIFYVSRIIESPETPEEIKFLVTTHMMWNCPTGAAKDMPAWLVMQKASHAVSNGDGSGKGKELAYQWADREMGRLITRQESNQLLPRYKEADAAARSEAGSLKHICLHALLTDIDVRPCCNVADFCTRCAREQIYHQSATDGSIVCHGWVSASSRDPQYTPGLTVMGAYHKLYPGEHQKYLKERGL